MLNLQQEQLRELMIKRPECSEPAARVGEGQRKVRRWSGSEKREESKSHDASVAELEPILRSCAFDPGNRNCRESLLMATGRKADSFSPALPT